MATCCKQAMVTTYHGCTQSSRPETTTALQAIGPWITPMVRGKDKTEWQTVIPFPSPTCITLLLYNSNKYIYIHTYVRTYAYVCVGMFLYFIENLDHVNMIPGKGVVHMRCTHSDTTPTAREAHKHSNHLICLLLEVREVTQLGDEATGLLVL